MKLELKLFGVSVFELDFTPHPEHTFEVIRNTDGSFEFADSHEDSDPDEDDYDVIPFGFAA